MEVKKYVAHTLSDALMKAREDFGEDCLLVNQRKIKIGGMFGYGGTDMIEVTIASGLYLPGDAQPEQQRPRAARRAEPQRPAKPQRQEEAQQEIDPAVIFGPEQQQPARAPRIYGGSQPQMQQPVQQQPSFQQQQLPAQQQAPQPQQPYQRPDPASEMLLEMVSRMQQQIEVLARQINKPQPQPAVVSPQAHASSMYPGKLQRAYEVLQRSEVSENITMKIMNDLMTIPDTSKENWDIVKEHMRTRMTGMLRISGQISADSPADNAARDGDKLPKLFAFIGTTGVGKTTTLAKIATNLVLKSKKRVVFLTIDTYRIAATQQLSVLGDIIGIPTEVVYKDTDFLPCIQRHREADIILIDTAGRSQKNNLELLELKKYLYPDKDFNIDISLVICSTTKYRDMQDIVKNFGGKVNFDKLIFTKTDESTTWGPIFSIAAENEKPLTYLSNGQNIPDDILPAEANFIVRKILEYEEA